jgi:hypothetical protein
MARKVPKYIRENIYKTSKLMQKVVDLNFELEEWLEKQGIKDGYDMTYSYRESRGYEIYDVEGFIAKVEEQLKG